MNQKPVIALAGNPNVGKSTVFNELTGLRQHTGNWPGKTVACARGEFTRNGKTYTLVDLPGTYSLMAHSAEEEIARDFICEEHPDAVIIVCDATCLERNLNLALQIRQMTGRGILCVNLCDEARRKGIDVDFNMLSDLLRMPVVSCSASAKEGMEELAAAAVRMCETRQSVPFPCSRTNRRQSLLSGKPKKSLPGPYLRIPAASAALTTGSTGWLPGPEPASF